MNTTMKITIKQLKATRDLRYHNFTGILIYQFVWVFATTENLFVYLWSKALVPWTKILSQRTNLLPHAFKMSTIPTLPPHPYQNLEFFLDFRSSYLKSPPPGLDLVMENLNFFCTSDSGILNYPPLPTNLEQWTFFWTSDLPTLDLPPNLGIFFFHFRFRYLKSPTPTLTPNVGIFPCLQIWLPQITNTSHPVTLNKLMDLSYLSSNKLSSFLLSSSQ